MYNIRLELHSSGVPVTMKHRTLKTNCSSFIRAYCFFLIKRKASVRLSKQINIAQDIVWPKCFLHSNLHYTSPLCIYTEKHAAVTYFIYSLAVPVSNCTSFTSMCWQIEGSICKNASTHQSMSVLICYNNSELFMWK